MGNTSSHKHMRSEFMKGSNMNHSSYMSQGGQSLDYSHYNHDDIIEDEEVSFPINSKSSYVNIYSFIFLFANN